MLRKGFPIRAGLVCAAAGALAALPAASSEAKKRPKPPTLKVMTRNVYLGADLTSGVTATSLQKLVDAAGGILHQVDQNKFQVRARGLAAEIRSQSPDLVGLQEVALWRTAPCSENPLPPKATHVRYDYLKLLLGQLNRGKVHYRAAVVQPEFDFEVWANTDGNEATHGPNCPLGSEINGRLTMRDVILVRRGVKVSNPAGGHYGTLLQERPGGVPVNVTRGWARLDVRVPRAGTFRFVDTHLEAFDSAATNHTNQNTDVGKGQVREAQAKELVGRGGAASGRLPVILVGDLNSDRATAGNPGDARAYNAVLRAGFAERSTSRPLGCCLDAAVLTASGRGRVSQLNHKVDHILTNAPRKVRLVTSGVTGRHPVNGFWDSDHAGLWSTLSL